MPKKIITMMVLALLAGCGVAPNSACLATVGERPPGRMSLGEYEGPPMDSAATSATSIDVLHSRHAVTFYPAEGRIRFAHVWVVAAEAVTQAAEVVAQGGWEVEAVGADGATLKVFPSNEPPPTAEQILATQAKWYWFGTELQASIEGELGEHLSFERSGSIATNASSVYQVTAYEENCTSADPDECRYPIDAGFLVMTENTGLRSLGCRAVNLNHRY